MRGFGISSLALMALVAQESSAFLLNIQRRLVPYNQPILHATLDQQFSKAGGPMDDGVRQAYEEWCKFYGKQFDESRLPSFTSNFIQVEEYFKQTGKAIRLNEYADLTSEEYKSLNSGAPASFSAAPGNDSQSTVDVDERILEAYKEWCDWHGKTLDMARVEIFSSNFVKVEQLHKKSDTLFKLNEFADLTRDEFEERMSSPARSAPQTTDEWGFIPDAKAKRKIKEESRLRGKAEATRRQKVEEVKLEALDVEFLRVEVDVDVEAEAEAEASASTVPHTSEGWGLRSDVEATWKAEEESRLRGEAEARRKVEEEAKLKALEKERLKAEARIKAEKGYLLKAEAEARRKAEDEARMMAEAEARRKTEEDTRLKAEEVAARHKAEAENARLKAEAEEAEARRVAAKRARLKKMKVDDPSKLWT